MVELQTYICNATRIVNYRPLTPLTDDPRDYTAISPSSLLTPLDDPHTPLGQPHNKDHLRRNYMYRYNISLAQQFWKRWIRFYLPLLQKLKKWLTVADNLHVGVSRGPGDFNKRGNYKLGRISEVLPQMRRGKALVQGRAKIAVSSCDCNGKPVVTYIDCDISKIAPLELE